MQSSSSFRHFSTVSNTKGRSPWLTEVISLCPVGPTNLCTAFHDNSGWDTSFLVQMLLAQLMKLPNRVRFRWSISLIAVFPQLSDEAASASFTVCCETLLRTYTTFYCCVFTKSQVLVDCDLIVPDVLCVILQLFPKVSDSKWHSVGSGLICW